jgi:hypothetical protein
MKFYPWTVDGNWADWSQWSACDVTCGNGKHTRIRTCTNPAPSYQGLECEGKNMDLKPCQRPLCPGTLTFPCQSWAINTIIKISNYIVLSSFYLNQFVPSAIFAAA